MRQLIEIRCILISNGLRGTTVTPPLRDCVSEPELRLSNVLHVAFSDLAIEHSIDSKTSERLLQIIININYGI